MFMFKNDCGASGAVLYTAIKKYSSLWRLIFDFIELRS